MQKKALVIVNQHTARPKLRSDLLDILDTITKGGYDCLVRPTQSACDAERFVAGRDAGDDLVVCIGGDGTLNEVVAGAVLTAAGQKTAGRIYPGGNNERFCREHRASVRPWGSGKVHDERESETDGLRTA